MAGPKLVLGRGLSSLIPNKQKTEDSQEEKSLSVQKGSMGRQDDILSSNSNRDQISYIQPGMISVNPYQPRDTFEEQKLKELAASIQVHGIISPLIVTKEEDGTYQLIAGERRLKAAMDLGLKEVPVIIRKAGAMEKMELALIENVKREDLNLIELARGYKRLTDEFPLTQEELAKKIGKSRPHITNTLRLLGLPAQIQDSLVKREISEGHAKVILSLDNEVAQLNLWKKIRLNKGTVRTSGQEARRVKVKTHSRRVKARDANLVGIEEKLEEKSGTRVHVRGTMQKGQIVADYFSKEELERIVENF